MDPFPFLLPLPLTKEGGDGFVLNPPQSPFFKGGCSNSPLGKGELVGMFIFYLFLDTT